jgi:hypothetical protein
VVVVDGRATCSRCAAVDPLGKRRELLDGAEAVWRDELRRLYAKVGIAA